MADITGLGSIADLGTTILNKIFPDKTEAEKAQFAMAMAQLQGELQNQAAQIEVNKVEAASTRLWVSGWRPLLGWTCGGALIWQSIVQPIAAFILTVVGHPVVLPVLNDATLNTVLFTLLGVGTMRTVDKIKGVAAR